jgi:hypothetical protein
LTNVIQFEYLSNVSATLKWVDWFNRHNFSLL